MKQLLFPFCLFILLSCQNTGKQEQSETQKEEVNFTFNGFELGTSKKKVKDETLGFGDERIRPGTVIYTDGANFDKYPTRKLSFFFIDNKLANASAILSTPNKDEYSVLRAKFIKQYGAPTREDSVSAIIRTEWESKDALLSVVSEKAYGTCVVSLDAKLTKLREIGGADK